MNMRNLKGFDPKGVAFRSERNLIMVEWAMKWGSSIATSLAVMVATYVASYGFIGSIHLFGIDVGNVAAMIISIVCALLAGWATDFAFGDFLKECLFQLLQFLSLKWLKNNNPQSEDTVETDTWFSKYLLSPILFIIKFVIVCALFWFDFVCIKTTDTPVQSFAAQKEEIDLKKEISELKKGLSDPTLEKSISAYDDKISSTKESIYSKNKGLVDLIKEKNGWAKKEIDAKIASGTKADERQKAKLERIREKSMASTAAIIEKNANAISDKNEQIQRENREKKAAVSSIYKYFGIGMKLMSILCSFALVVSFMKKHPHYDANGDGVVDSQDVNASFQ